MQNFSMFSEGLPNSVNVDNAQIRWCRERCEKDNCIFTVQLLVDDIPVVLKCLFCGHLKNYVTKVSNNSKSFG
jgi:hypothetical protein